MKVRTLDGKKIIEINAVDSRLKEAVDAEANGYPQFALQKLDEAIQAERKLENAD
jgi:hypothetical protein